MTLEQLRIFEAVAQREHVTRAAQALNLTQSAVSAAIAALEERHSVALFSRVGRRIELTDAGRLFLDEARAVLARARAAELALSEIAGLERGGSHNLCEPDHRQLLVAAAAGQLSPGAPAHNDQSRGS
jgi:DNA-binding transcriptional LysR family regulator